jgi:hypothetical protein
MIEPKVLAEFESEPAPPTKRHFELVVPEHCHIVGFKDLKAPEPDTRMYQEWARDVSRTKLEGR